jgi:protein-disulfide isomerase
MRQWPAAVLHAQANVAGTGRRPGPHVARFVRRAGFAYTFPPEGGERVERPQFLSRVRKDRRWLVGSVLGFLAAAGIVVSALSIQVHYRTVESEGGYRSFCTLSDTVDCTAVVLSPQSRLLGIPIPILGLFTYLVVFGLHLRTWKKDDLEFARSLSLITLVGFGCTLYSAYLWYIVVTVIRRHCILCYTLYGVNAGLVLFGLLFAWRWRVSVAGMLAWEVHSILKNRVVAIGTAVLIMACMAGAFVMRNVQRTLLIQRNPMLAAVFDNSAQRLPVYLANIPTKGPEDAPVTIIEFNDFQCPFCRQSARTLDRVSEKFPGKIHREFMNLPLDKACNPFITQSLHGGYCRLALGGRVAYRAGRFWEFHERAFDHVGQWSDEALASLLVDLGIPKDEVEERLMDPEVRDSVARQITDANRLGVTRTPSFIVNGMLLEGNFDPWLWERIIRMEIERAEQRSKRKKPENPDNSGLSLPSLH